MKNELFVFFPILLVCIFSCSTPLEIDPSSVLGVFFAEIDSSRVVFWEIRIDTVYTQIIDSQGYERWMDVPQIILNFQLDLDLYPNGPGILAWYQTSEDDNDVYGNGMISYNNISQMYRNVWNAPDDVMKRAWFRYVIYDLSYPAEFNMELIKLGVRIRP